MVQSCAKNAKSPRTPSFGLGVLGDLAFLARIRLVAATPRYGIELLNANAQLSKGKGLVLENLTTGHREKLSLAS